MHNFTSDCRMKDDETVLLVEAALIALRIASRAKQTVELDHVVADLMEDPEIRSLLNRAPLNP